MKLKDYTVESFIDEIDAKSPAPGGGSASALMSSIGVALIRMVGHLTVDKKKFASLDSKIQFEFKDSVQSLKYIKDELIHLIDSDTEAFNDIMKSYQYPKVTDEEIMARNQAIQLATEKAIMVPLKVATLSLSALHQCDMIVKYGNKQTISDLGVACLAITSGALGGLMNVLINLQGLHDEIAVKQYRLQVEDMMKEIHHIRDEMLEKVYLSLK